MANLSAEQKAQLEKWKKTMREISKITRENRPLLSGAFVLQRYSMHNAPVITGFLKNSHGSVGTNAGAEVQVYAEYAHYVEFGTSKMSARPFLRPALDEHKNEIIEAIEKQAAEEIRKAAQK
jgi:HK97 gp10 family phage protein